MPADPNPWKVPGSCPVLADDEVHVWLVGLFLQGPLAAEFQPTLSPDERARANRFRFTRDRTRFVLARGAMRTILGGYLNVASDRLIFSYGTNGKPELAAARNDQALQFNLSHAGDFCLAVVSRVGAVGVDIERVRWKPDLLSIAAHNFSAQEFAKLENCSALEKAALFFHYWTCKEAFLKAHGAGLGLGLNAIDLSSLRSLRAFCICHWGDYALRRIAVPTGYAAAIAVKGTGWRLKSWRFTNRIRPT